MSQTEGQLACLDPEAIIPISRLSTAAFRTGAWTTQRPVFAEKTSPCRAACPNGHDIPRALHRAAQGDWDGALAVFLQETPLPGVCGRVCDHPCQGPCNRAGADQAVTIRALERAAADLGQAEPAVLTEAGQGKPVAVVGSGPAGLAAAYHLARLGHPVTMFEAGPKPGGLLRAGLPAFRLPPAALEADLARIFKLPISFRPGQAVDQAGLERLSDDFPAVFLALGAQTRARLGLPGENTAGVIQGLDFLRRPDLQAQAQGAGVVVIGGGNTALDAARMALRRGARSVQVLYRRTAEAMPAFAEEVVQAQEEGVEFEYLAGPAAFRAQAGRLVGLTWRRLRLDGEGRLARLAAAGPEMALACDLALVAVGQGPDLATLPAGLGQAAGRLWTDPWGRTSRAGWWAGGDLTPTRAAVATALASGKRAALAIHLSLAGAFSEDALAAVLLGGGPALSLEAFFHRPPTWRPGEVVQVNDWDLLLTPPQAPPAQLHLPLADRRSSPAEVVQGLTPDQARAEASRCYYCGTCVDCGSCRLLCPDAALGQGFVAQDEHCKGCGTCAAACPRGVLSLEGGR